jgi:DNA-binding NarL/FixJ family response regulator
MNDDDTLIRKTGSAHRIRVLIVDDDPIVRMGINSLIDTQEDMVVCGEAGHAAEALEKLLELKPDVVTMDINLGCESGLDVTREMRATGSGAKILVLSLFDEPHYVELAAAAGAHGYVAKLAAIHTLTEEIRKLSVPKSPGS